MEQTGRQRATRIALDYHKSRDDLWRRRMIVAAVALVLALAYIAYGSLAPRGQMTLSHGPLSRAHARWDVDCQQCHDNFSAIHARAWSLNKAAMMAINDKCTKCHSGSPHHSQMLRDNIGARTTCTACHHEHRGRNAALTLVEDKSCTKCHQQLDLVRLTDVNTPAPTPIAVSVTAFAKGKHPDFRSLIEDPGNVRFNHALHLLPGIKAPDSRDPGMTYKDVVDDDPHSPWSSLMVGETANQLVQLDCNNCHGLQNTNHNSTNRHMDKERQFMEPVTYEAHCKVCHVLDYTAGEKSRTVPHGITLAKTREYLELAAEGAGASDSQLQIDTTMEHLERKCAKCHDLETVQGPRHKVVPPPRNWLRHARFNHSAHSGVTCTTCHSQSTQAAEGGAITLIDGGTDQNRVMIKGADVCFQCHNQADSRPSIARTDCVECHRYHGEFSIYEPLLPKTE